MIPSILADFRRIFTRSSPAEAPPPNPMTVRRRAVVEFQAADAKLAKAKASRRAVAALQQRKIDARTALLAQDLGRDVR